MIVLSENVLHFISKLARAVYDLVGDSKVHTGAYHPCTNGVVERVNNVLAKMLSMAATSN